MPRYFSPIVDLYFTRWIGASTWDSMHSLDMERFYQFLKALRRYRRKPLTDKFFETLAKGAKDYHPDLDDNNIEEIIKLFYDEAQICFTYESVQFPDPLLEMNNPYDVILSLTTLQKLDEKGNIRPRYTPEEIDVIVEKHFGANWKEQYK